MSRWERLVEPGRSTRWIARHERGVIVASGAVASFAALSFAYYLLVEGLVWPLVTFGCLAGTAVVWIANARQTARYVRAWEKQEADEAHKRSDD